MCYKSLYLFIFLIGFSLACAGLDASTPASGGPPAVTPPPATVTPAPVPTASPPANGMPTPPGLETVTVTAVVDGDTIELTNGRRVRYIGLNTPERDQPYYAAAAALNRQLVEGKNVQLEFDVETFDQYGRSLAYVWVEGRLVNLEIVQQGYANAYT